MRRAGLLAYLALLLLLTVGFSKWAYDDVFITYRYAANLASGAGMVYNPGERVLSTTSLLWAVLLAPVAALGWDVHAAAVLLGAASLAVGGYSLYQLGRAAHQPWVSWAGLLFYPLHPLVTGTLGSETPLYLALGLGALALFAHRQHSLAALCAGLAAAARPDGLLFALVMGLDALAQFFVLRRRRQAFALPWRALGVFALAWLPWVLWAGWYYGSPLPVTLAAKQGQAQLAVSASFWQGVWQTLLILGQAAYFRWQLFLAGLGAGWLAWRLWQAWRSTTARTWVEAVHPLTLLFAWTATYFAAYVLLGVTRYFWYYAPLLPALAVGIGLGLGWMDHLVRAALAHALSFQPQDSLWQLVRCRASSAALGALRGTAPRTRAWIARLTAVLACLALLLGQWQAVAQSPPDARYTVYRQVGVWLAQHTAPSDRVAALEVGIIGYYSARPMVDFAGLLQPPIAAQLSRQGSYDRTALWTVQQYQPQALVLLQGLFPELETWLAGTNCAESARFPGLKWDLVVYTCSW